MAMSRMRMVSDHELKGRHPRAGRPVRFSLRVVGMMREPAPAGERIRHGGHAPCILLRAAWAAT
jgi:hypothetical protein